MATVRRTDDRRQGTDASRHHPRRLITVLFTAANVYLGLKIGITFATSIPARSSRWPSCASSRRDHPGKQHRPDHRVGGGDAVGDHLRPARPDHGRLVDRLPLLAVRRGDRHRRHPGRDVFRAAAPRARDRIGPALSRRRCRGRSAEGRRRGRRRRGENAAGWPRSSSSSLVSAAMPSSPRRGSSRPTRPATFKFGAGATTVSTSLSMALIGVGHLVGLGVGIAMLVGMIISWFVLVPWQTGHAPASPRPDVEALSDRVPRKGPLHRRRHDRRRRDLDPAQDHRPDHQGHHVGDRRQPRARAGGQEALPLTERDCRSPSSAARSSPR